jgi:hypothetical protein
VVTCYKRDYLPEWVGIIDVLVNINLNTINVKTPINNNEKAMKTKDEYIENLASELKEWSAQIDLLAAKTENVAQASPKVR